MKAFQREYPQFSACGLNCGLCPRYHTKGTSRCPGCGGKGFAEKHPSCGVLNCVQRHEIEYCYQCTDYPCPKYDSADSFDSFITHKNMFQDFSKAKQFGIDAYQAELNEKIRILQKLLVEYNDGRRKNLFCITVNLLDLDEIKEVTQQLDEMTTRNETKKEKAVIAANLFQARAKERGIELKLNQKPQKKK